MADIEDRPRSLLVRTMQGDDGGVGLAVRDAGVGVDPGVAGKLFQSVAADGSCTTTVRGWGTSSRVSVRRLCSRSTPRST